MKTDDQSRFSGSNNIAVQSYRIDQFRDCVEAVYMVEAYSEVSLIVPPNQFTGLIFIRGDKGYYRTDKLIKGIRLEGIMLKSSHVKIVPDTKILGVRMFGNGHYPFLPFTGKDVVNRSIEVNLPEHNELIQQIMHSDNNEKAVLLISELLTRLYNPVRDKEAYLIKKFYTYMKSCQHCLPNIIDFCNTTNTNYSTLNRAFQKILGLSTKKFERLIKFRRALNVLVNTPDKLTNIGIDAGYFDQSHFIREFKHFMQIPPSEYLNFIKTNMEHRNFNDIELDVI